MNPIKRLWSGALSLEKAFWEWAVFGGVLVNVVSSIGFLVLVLNDYLISAVIVGYGLSLPYNFLATVGVWRSADRVCGDRRWAETAKVATVLGMVLLSIT